MKTVSIGGFFREVLQLLPGIVGRPPGDSDHGRRGGAATVPGEVLGYIGPAAAGDRNLEGCGRTITECAGDAGRPRLSEALASMRAGSSLTVEGLDHLADDRPALAQALRALAGAGAHLRLLPSSRGPGIDTSRLDTAMAADLLDALDVFASPDLSPAPREEQEEAAAAEPEGASEEGVATGAEAQDPPPRRPRSRVSPEEAASARALLESGMSVAAVSARTGIGQSTLYAYFPRGRKPDPEPGGDKGGSDAGGGETA